MTRARKINATIWAIVAIAVITMVCVQWHRQGCEASSLIAAIAFYASASAALWKTTDSAINKH